MSDAIAIRLGGQFGEFFGAGNLNLSKVDAILQNMLFGIFTGEKNSVYIIKHSTVVFSQSLQHQMLLFIDLPLSRSNVLVCKNSKVQCNYQENPEKWKIRGTPPKKYFNFWALSPPQ